MISFQNIPEFVFCLAGIKYFTSFNSLLACRRQCLTWLSEATCNICAPHERARSLLNAVLLLCYCFRVHSSRITSTYCRRFKGNPQYLFLILSAFASAFELSSVPAGFEITKEPIFAQIILWETVFSPS